ncbi:putative halogenase [Mycena latifolia]|nr:putative halogenase [Mycena latifolia]
MYKGISRNSATIPPHYASKVPELTNILVIGGAPAGSFAAAALAREGFEVTLLEREHFPRYHIGESMLSSLIRPTCKPVKVVDYGFCVKVGAVLKFNQTKREGHTDFINPDRHKAAWNVTCAEFDETLLRNASENGVRVYEGVSVETIVFSPENNGQPVSVKRKADTGSTERLKFNWLMDASARNGIMSTKYLKNRKFNQALRSYWKNAGMYAPARMRDERGWAWFIRWHRVNAQHSHNQLNLVPGVMRLLADATFLGEVKSAGDYSYSATQYAGPNYHCWRRRRFIDPFFSSGMHLAFGGGLSAASTIAASIRGQCTEHEAIQFHNEKTGTSYTRFFLVFLSAYRQITSQSVPVLSDIDEDNFDRAFEFIRPGAADTDPTMHQEVAKRVDPTLMADNGPILGPKDVAAVAGDDEEAETVLHRINSRKAVEAIHWQPNFRGEMFNGFSIVLERGNLGLRRAGG